MKDKLLSFLKLELVRYLIMAVIVVLIEIGSFIVINSTLNIAYLIATPASMAVGIILNWYGSHTFVFHHRAHHPRKEFTLVLIASLIGVVLQLTVTAFAVEVIMQLPIAGKVAAIAVTFFWNYWFRKKYIFYRNNT